MSGQVRRVALLTATEPEPRRYGKPVVLGGVLDHLCDRLGAPNVHVVLLGRKDVERPATPYPLHVIAKPGTVEQAGSVLRRVVLPPRRPLQEAVLRSGRVLGELRRLLDDLEPDLEIWDTVRLGQYAPLVRPRRRVLYADDLFSLRYAAMLQELDPAGTTRANPGGEFQKLLPGPARRLLATPRVYRPLLRLERDLVARSELRQPAWFERTLLISAAETALLRTRVPDAVVDVLPPLLREPAPAERRFSGEARFAFVGGFDYAPNVDGLDWFLARCRDAVLAALPNLTLHVVGPGTERGLPSAAGWGGRVRFTGWVDDMDAVLGPSAALLSPLRTGGGVKIKVLEALARGLPVVATPPGVQGIEAPAEAGCLVGDGPAELAAALAAVRDPATNRQLSKLARHAWDTRYAPELTRRRYDEIFLRAT